MLLRTYTSCLLFLTSFALAQGQDWKTKYDQAVKEYQAGQLDQALTSAKEALKLSPETEQKGQAYTLQLITVICLDNGTPDEGLQWVGKESELFSKLEGPTSKMHAEAQCKHCKLLVQANQFGSAETKCKEALAALTASGSDKSVDFIDMNFLLGQVLATNNQPEALAVVEKSVEHYANIPESGESLIEAMLLSAQLSEKAKDLPSAEKKYKQLSALLETNGLKDLPAYGQSQTALSKLAVASGDTAAAATLLSGNAVDNSEKAAQLLKLALGYHNSSKPDLAYADYRLAEKAVADGGLRTVTAFAVYLNFGRLLTEQRRLDDAGARLNDATSLSAELFKEPASEIALLNFSLGDLAIAREDAAGATNFYQQARANSSAMTLPSRVQYLTRAARKLLARNIIVPAINLLESEITLLPDETVPDADFLAAIATYTQALSDNNQHSLAIQKLKELQAKALTPESKLNLQSQEAAILEQSGQWSAALALLNEVAKAPGLGADAKLQNDFLVGRLYLKLGNFAESEKHLIACMNALNKPGHYAAGSLALDVSNSLANLYTKLGNYGQAEVMYMDLLSKPEPAPGFHASIQQNLAALFVEAGRYTEAQLLLEDVLQRDLAHYGDKHPDYAASLQNIGAVYLKNKELDKARKAYEQALQINAKSGNQNLPYATTAANLGIVYKEMGDDTKALQYISESLKVREKILGKDHPDYVFNEYNLAHLLTEMDKAPEALPHFRHVATYYLREIKELFRAMSEREKTAYYNKTNEVITGYLDFAIHHSEADKNLLAELYDFRLATKALLLSSSTKVRNRILSSKDAQVMESFASWLSTKEELGKLYSLSSADRSSSAALISGLQQKANDLEKQLSQQSELFGADAGQDTISWKAVKRSLQPGDAAIEFIRLGLSKKDSVLYAALVLRPDAALPQLVVFPNSPRLEGKEFSYYRNSIHYQLLNKRSYDFFWKPLESVLKGVKRIYVSPDGVFNKLSIATLYDPVANQYLIERYSIGLVSNTKELVGSSTTTEAQRTASLIGFPKYGSQAAPAGAAGTSRGMNTLAQDIIGNGIPELPGTLEEINKIDAFLKETKWSTSVFTSDAASEQAIRKQQSPGVLHIATHGFFIESNEEAPVVGGGDMSQSRNNPLLRSGLILAGAANMAGKTTSTDDGILTAYEAMNLTLDKTDLVVLSACETGSGEVKNGEGVYGLQRSFLVAGASNLLMSLWKVDDTATQELMMQLYKELQSSKDKTTAFRDTQLEIQKRHPEPYYWGGFVLIGHN